MKYAREVERKLTVEGLQYETAHTFLKNLVDRDPKEGVSNFDRFWVHPTVDFIRLRENSHELTVKVTDKGNTIDRIEENVLIQPESHDTATRLLSLLFGKPALTLRKSFSVFYASDVTICLYRVEEDTQKRVFLEVEANPEKGDIRNVDAWVARLIDHGLQLTPESRSLFQVFYEEGAK